MAKRSQNPKLHKVIQSAKKHGKTAKEKVHTFVKSEQGKRVIRIVGIAAATALVEALPAGRGMKVLKRIAGALLAKNPKA